jgi:CBS domain-containing protein
MTDTAAAIMTKTVVTIGPDDLVPAIAARLAAHNISAAPVVDGAGRLLGMISEGDLLRPFGAELQTRRAWWLEVLAEGEQLAPAFLDYLRLDNRRAADLMTRDVVTAAETTPVPEIADILTRHRIKRVPILRDGRIIGIVSRADIVRCLAGK